MPKFTTISPTCQPGGKEDAWQRFRDGGYVAIGWCYDHDLSNRTLDQVLELVPVTSASDRDVQDGLRSMPVFWELAERGASNAGDYIAVRNTNDGLFGIGVIRSGYKYSRYKHPTGVAGHFYPHFLEVDWIHTDYISRGSLDFDGEKSWVPFGTLGLLRDGVPNYVRPYITGLPDVATSG